MEQKKDPIQYVTIEIHSSISNETYCTYMELWHKLIGINFIDNDDRDDILASRQAA